MLTLEGKIRSLGRAFTTSLNLTMLASRKKEEKPMRKMASQFILLGSALIETIWAIDANIVASILSS